MGTVYWTKDAEYGDAIHGCTVVKDVLYRGMIRQRRMQNDSRGDQLKEKKKIYRER